MMARNLHKWFGMISSSQTQQRAGQNGPIGIDIIYLEGAMDMKRQIAVGIVLFAGFSGGVFAAPNCAPNNRVNGNDLTTLVSDNTVCATRGTDKWQEQHRSGAQLWDYKKGASDPVDPSKQVGTWSIGPNSVTYSYTGGPSYTYSIYREGGGTYSFCSNSSVVVGGATFKPNNSSCP